jgi:hypothetical protein
VSRSNPTHNAPNPAARWFEWNGEAGIVRYYDKDEKKNVDHVGPFGFVLLDEMATVGGWHEASKSGIYANEVRDTREGALLVRAFKGGTLAEGLYRDIKDRVNVQGGQFVANLYIAFKRGSGLSIGGLKFKGAALGAWMEFRKANRDTMYEQAIEINGYAEGKKGRVIFRVPTFHLKPLSEASNTQAIALDVELQAFLTAYLARTKRDQVDTAAPDVDDAQPPDDIDDAMPTYDETEF